MAFTKEEFEAWYKAKIGRENRSSPEVLREPITTCIICNRDFGSGEGMITQEASICNICYDEWSLKPPHARPNRRASTSAYLL